MPNNASTQTPDRDAAPPDPVTPKAHLAASPEPENRIQILDLHTREPVISYKNQVYTCQWTTTIGTDILLVPPDPALPFQPLYEAPGFNILATTNIKLVGEPVQLIPRSKGQATPVPSLPSGALASSSVASAPPALVWPTTAQANSPHIPVTTDATIAFQSSAVAHSGVVTQTTPQPLLAPPATLGRLVPFTGMSSTRQSQGRFLERLIALKAARGEQDEVLLHHRQRQNDSSWKTWTDGGGRARQRRMRAGTEGGEGWEDDDSDEGWGDDYEGMEGSDEDDDVGARTVDQPAGVDGTSEAIATAEAADTATEEAPM